MAQTNRGNEHPVAREIGRAGTPGMTANDLLDDDHNRVLQMFNEYSSDATPEEKHRIAQMICRELKIHARIEEEIYYPRVRSKSGAESMLDKAAGDHERADELIRKLENASTHDRSIDSNIQALADLVRQHIHYERDKLFELAGIADCDTPEMARQLLARKKELEQEMD